MTGAQFFAAICPSADRVRGIREVFYKTNPFKDNKNPTKAEVDEWHRIAILRAKCTGKLMPSLYTEPAAEPNYE